MSFVEAKNSGPLATANPSVSAAPFSANIGALALLVAQVTYASGGTVASVTLGGQAATLFPGSAITDSLNSQTQAIYYVLSATGGTTASGTLTMTGATAFCGIQVVQRSEVATGTNLGGTTWKNPAGATATTASFTTTQAGDYVFFGFVDSSGATTAIGTPTGTNTTFTNRDTETNAGIVEMAISDGVQSAAGATTGTWTWTTNANVLLSIAAFKVSAGGSANPPPSAPQQAATHYRTTLTMPQRLGIGMAVFLAPANIGPTVPQGDPVQLPAHHARAAYRDAASLAAQPMPANVVVTALAVATGNAVPVGANAAGQARAAYREAAHLVAQPTPPRITQAGAVASPYQPPATVIFTPPAQLWPYAATQLPKPVASVFGISAIYLGQPPLNHPLAQPWPHGTQPRGQVVTQPGAAPAAYLAPNKTNHPLPQPWPYAATMLAVPTTSQFGIPDSDLIFDRLYPLMVAQTPWPYTVATRLQPSITQPGAAPSVYIAPNAVPVPIMQLWPYASTMLPEPSSSYWGITVNQVPPAAVPVPLTFPRWPYAPTMLAPPGPASTIQQVVQQLLPNAVPLPIVQPWPYASIQPTLPLPIMTPDAQLLPNPVFVPTSLAWPYALAQRVLGDTADLAPNLGVQIPPNPVLQWYTYPRWPAIVAVMASLPTPMAWLPYIPPGAVFPLPGQVLAGVIYGPNGNDYTGTLAAGTGTAYLRRR